MGGLVGRIHQLGTREAITGFAAAHPHAHAHPAEGRVGLVLDGELFHGGEDALGLPEGFLPAGFGQQHRELLAADPADQLPGAAEQTAQGLGQLDQAAVALGMAVEVVVGLEVIQIEQQQGQLLVLAAVAADLGGEGVIKAAPVAHLGEGIGEREGLLLAQHIAQPLHQAVEVLGEGLDLLRQVLLIEGLGLQVAAGH